MPNAVEWALVADARHVRILERPDIMSEPDNPASHEHGTERPGRVRESLGSARHAIEPLQDAHRAAEASFAQHLANELEKAAATGCYDSLLLVGRRPSSTISARLSAPRRASGCATACTRTSQRPASP